MMMDRNGFMMIDDDDGQKWFFWMSIRDGVG